MRVAAMSATATATRQAILVLGMLRRARLAVWALSDGSLVARARSSLTSLSVGRASGEVLSRRVITDASGPWQRMSLGIS